MERRGRQKIERGPVSHYVALNVSLLRKKRGLSQQELSDRLAELGRPMLPSALSKIESEDRGVDVDDLMALAVALRVNPSRLLLWADADEREMRLTPDVSVPGWAAWQWADGFAPLPTLPPGEGYNTEAEREDFLIHARPPKSRREEQHPLMRAVHALRFSAWRVVAQATRTPIKTAVLASTLDYARRDLQRVTWELDRIEDEAAGRGER